MKFGRFHGPAGTTLRAIAADAALRRARMTATGSRGAARLILGIGQVHPVLRGRFEGFQARRIGNVQAWIYRLAAMLHSRFAVASFGQEGLSVMGERGKSFRMEGELLEDLGRALQRAGEDALMRDTAKEWRSGLRRNDGRLIARAVATLNGLTLLQAADKRVSVFPIEQHAVHGSISAAVDELQQRIAKIEGSAAYAAVRTKNGKGLTKQEYAAAVERNALVREWNGLLKHPERDRAIFREILEAAERQTLTVFVLGEGHRKGFLKLAKAELPQDALFCWVTPPHLWWWAAMVRRGSWALAILLVIAGIAYLR